MSAYIIKGSYMVDNKKNYYSSQTDMAEGWRVALPKRNMVETPDSIKKYQKAKKDGDDSLEHFKREFVNKIIYNEVTLAQFPPHMSHRYKEDEEYYFDNFFKFKVIKTKHDDIIMELIKMFQIKYPRPEEQAKMAELAEFLESNDITGWVTIRGKKMSH